MYLSSSISVLPNNQFEVSSISWSNTQISDMKGSSTKRGVRRSDYLLK
ncbi:hypothetical protein HanOQP8_Chr09g0310751 [Helianthus annuus]|nr:hypothetical protein HanOQP8_Chr09g0310751 [Helianthus annuus]